jgi:NodT family efflux transporter outer membrane factor (OMF) lipoprotein
LSLFVLLAGCIAVSTPESEKAPDAHYGWSSDLSYGLSSEPADLTTWWKQFDDPVLDRLIDEALKENLNLAISASRVREARGLRGISEAGRFPTLTASGSAQESKRGDADSSSIYYSGFDASWELDLFGRVKMGNEAAQADLEAAEESFYDVRISLIAEVALNYVELRSFENRLHIAKENVGLQTESLRITEARYRGEVVSDLDVQRARTNRLNTKAGIPPLEAGAESARNRLATLLGKKPGELDAALASPGPSPPLIPSPRGEIAVGIPADIIRRRPDIRQAERQLAAQSARVGVAKADLYPRFALTGSLSFSATDATNLFTTAARTLAIGPSFQWNVFSAGSIRNNINVQSERQEQALLQYEQVILTALEEVESAMTAFATEHDRRAKLEESEASARKAASISRTQYEAGLTDFTSVLDTERTLLSQEDQRAVSQAQVSSSLIRLYKALGGGWTPQALEAVDRE